VEKQIHFKSISLTKKKENFASVASLFFKKNKKNNLNFYFQYGEK